MGEMHLELFFDIAVYGGAQWVRHSYNGREKANILRKHKKLLY